jgi:hypothetical protein
MEDQKKAAPDNTPQPDNEELKKEELDDLAGGTGGGGTGPVGPVH